MPPAFRALILLLLFAQPVVAGSDAGRQAWVLATTSHDGVALDQPGADAVAVSRRLMAAGFSVTRRENADPRSLVLTERVAPVVVLYFSGPVVAEGTETWLLSAAEPGTPLQGWPLSATVRDLRTAGAQQVIAAIEGCHLPGAEFAPLPARATGDTAAGPDAAYPEDVVFLLSAAPGQPCAPGDPGKRMTDRLIRALAEPGRDFLAAFNDAPGQGWAEARLQHRLPPLVPAALLSPEPEAGAELLRSLPPDEAMRLRAPPGATGQPPGDLLLIDPAGGGTMADDGARAGPGSGDGTAGDGGLRLIPVAAGISARTAARPTPQGLPRPSVIVGEIGPESDLPAPGDNATAGAGGFPGMARAARLELRAADPAEFDALVDSGAFDPAPAELVPALQSELREARCYDGAIDGQWGPGSQAAVRVFFRERGGSPPEPGPGLALYRALLAGEAVRCPAPAVARATAPATARPAGGAARTGTASAVRPAAGAAPAGSGGAAAAPPQGGRRIDPRSVGLGIR